MAKAIYESGSDSGDGFSPLFPSPTARDGNVRRNSAQRGSGQGRGSSKRMIHCKQCGYVFDSNKVDTSGGAQDGDGGLEDVSTASATYTVSGVSHTETYPNVRQVSEGAGCCVCGSKNGAA